VAACSRLITGETVGMGPTGRAPVGPQLVLVAQAQTGRQARERVRAPAAAAHYLRLPRTAAPTWPAGWGAWLQIGFAARAFCWLFR